MHSLAMVTLKLCFGDARLLEIELIKHGICRLRHQTRRPRGARLSRAKWDAEADHRSKAVRTDQRRMPGHQRSPGMSHYDGLSLFERIEQTHNIANKVEERELVYGLGAFGLPVTAHVGCNSIKAGL